MQNIFNIIWFLLGLICGYLLNKEKSKEYAQVLADGMRKIVYKDVTIKPGVIHRPTAQQLKERELPDKRKAGLEAMRSTLKDVPELNK